jgi:hypothetical protein
MRSFPLSHDEGEASRRVRGRGCPLAIALMVLVLGLAICSAAAHVAPADSLPRRLRKGLRALGCSDEALHALAVWRQMPSACAPMPCRLRVCAHSLP